MKKIANRIAPALAVLALFAVPAPAAEIPATDIVINIVEARADEREKSGRDRYLEEKYLEPETLIVREPGFSLVAEYEVWASPQPEPLHSTNLSDPTVRAQ